MNFSRAIVFLSTALLCGCSPYAFRVPGQATYSNAGDYYTPEVREFYEGKCKTEAREVINQVLEGVTSARLVGIEKLPYLEYFQGGLAHVGLERIEKVNSVDQVTDILVEYEDIVEPKYRALGVTGREYRITDLKSGILVALRREFQWRAPRSDVASPTFVCPELARAEKTPEDFFARAINPASFGCWLKYREHYLDTRTPVGAMKPERSFNSRFLQQCNLDFWRPRGYTYNPLVGGKPLK